MLVAAPLITADTSRSGVPRPRFSRKVDTLGRARLPPRVALGEALEVPPWMNTVTEVAVVRVSEPAPVCMFAAEFGPLPSVSEANPPFLGLATVLFVARSSLPEFWIVTFKELR